MSSGLPVISGAPLSVHGPSGAGAPGKADGERVGLLAGGEAQPIFVADLRHFRRPEIGDLAALRRPAGLLPLGEDEAAVLPMLRSSEWRIGKASGASLEVATR